MDRPLRWMSVATALFLTFGSPLCAEDAADGNVLVTDSFENGDDAPDGWEQGAEIVGVKYVYDHNLGSDGKRSLSLQKSENRFFPIAQWSRQFKHASDKTALKVTTKVKAMKAAKATIDVQFMNANDEMIKHEWVSYIGQKKQGDPLANHDWKEYDGTVQIPKGTTQISIAFQIYGPGKVWFDELNARYVDADAAKNKDKTQGAAVPPQRPVEPGPSPIEIQTASGGVARFLLLPPGAGRAKPQTGHPLLLVLPGGDGSADFHAFVGQIHTQALDSRFVVTQVLAPPQIVWPTRSSTAQWRTTEESVGAIIDDVAQRHSIDREQVYALAWSSSGPAVYATLLQDQSPLAGAFIAMSVFKPDQLPPLANGAGKRIFLLHSPEDGVCPYRMAKDALKQLAAAGAKVTLVDYAGGHGWYGPVHDNIRTGMQWLQDR